MRENRVENHLIARVAGLQGIAVKLGVDGWPDRVVKIPGHDVWLVELKAPTGKLRGNQEYRKEQWVRVGGNWAECHTIEAVDFFMRQFLPCS
jgi:hypothetical protein